jgi:hypothetical protein
MYFHTTKTVSPTIPWRDFSSRVRSVRSGTRPSPPESIYSEICLNVPLMLGVLNFHLYFLCTSGNVRNQFVHSTYISSEMHYNKIILSITETRKIQKLQNHLMGLVFARTPYYPGPILYHATPLHGLYHNRNTDQQTAPLVQ